ncbi:DUF2382 domain-containing protein [Nostoc sp. FACHB-110]|uniref:DUF2382 domain-containing protein n=1 Tax=Nostoc sp. FACHB-110 TaxID=2692834 RepID=UPI001682A476|nr:DUF2382 domain-containing protein [Nostoc sp. FACHB-110]MBD2435666.1 DUF2382 domain-containing protein [Nostoc sp. FACHB-110]
MPLYKLAEFDPQYRETFGGDDVKSLDLYTEGGVKVGSVADALVDHDGRFRYLVIDTGFDTLGKKILLPIGLAHINYPDQRVYVDGLSKQQVEMLPEYSDKFVVDDVYEENVRSVFRPSNSDFIYDRNTYNYQQEPNLYNLNAQNHQTLRLYEERLIANKQRVKTGEVAVSKHIEIETAKVEVPVTKERVVIERLPATEGGRVTDTNELQFQEGEVARIEVYEETPEIRKEAFVREEVRVRKLVERDIVEAQETIRREELDINTTGELKIDDSGVNQNPAV